MMNGFWSQQEKQRTDDPLIHVKNFGKYTENPPSTIQ